MGLKWSVLEGLMTGLRRWGKPVAEAVSGEAVCAWNEARIACYSGTISEDRAVGRRESLRGADVCIETMDFYLTRSMVGAMAGKVGRDSVISEA